MLAVAGQTAGRRSECVEFFYGTLEYPRGNIGEKYYFFFFKNPELLFKNIFFCLIPLATPGISVCIALKVHKFS